jgi:hypothetical protein
MDGKELEKMRRHSPLLLAKVYLGTPGSEQELEESLGRGSHEVDEWVKAIKALPKEKVFITPDMEQMEPLNPQNKYKLVIRGVAAWAIEQYLIEMFSPKPY